MILELKQEIKELKVNNSYANQPRAKNNKFIANQKYCWIHGCNPTYNGKVCRNPADNYQPKATIDNLMGEPVLYWTLQARQEEGKQLTGTGCC